MPFDPRRPTADPLARPGRITDGAAAPAPPRRRSSPARFPTRRFRCRWISGDLVLEVDVIACTARRWALRPESAAGAGWSACAAGPIVIALKLTA